MDTVGNNDNFNFTGSMVSASLREALPGNAKKKDGLSARCWLCYNYIYSKLLSIRCHYQYVLQSKKKSFDAYQSLSSIFQ